MLGFKVKDSFRFNPFSGVLQEDLEAIIVPKFNTTLLISKIQSPGGLAIEFLGKKGRGKTTHLIYLQQVLQEYPIFLLKVGSSVVEIIKDASPIVFVDGIHHLSFKDKILLFKTKEKVIYTTHWSRKLTCFIAKKDLYSIAFKGIDVGILKEILNKRLLLASAVKLNTEMLFNDKEVTMLIKKYGDDYRGIINYLYEYY